MIAQVYNILVLTALFFFLFFLLIKKKRIYLTALFHLFYIKKIDPDVDIYQVYKHVDMLAMCKEKTTMHFHISSASSNTHVQLWPTEQR